MSEKRKIPLRMFVEFCILAIVATGCMFLCLWLVYPSRTAPSTASWAPFAVWVIVSARLFWVIWKINDYIEAHKDDERVEKELKAC